MRKKGILLLTMLLFCLGMFKLNAEAAVTIKNGTYNILSALNNNKAVDVAGAGKGNGTNIQLWDYVDELQQQFIFTKVSGTYYKITDVNSGRVLDVTGGVKRSGVNVQLYQYNGTAAQLWQLESAGSGYYYIKNKLGYYLDVSGASTKNGTNIQVYSRNKTNAQKFKLRATSAYTLISAGTYTFQSALNSKRVIDVSNAGTQNGTNIQLWESNNTNAQKFQVQLVALGYYKISNVISGKVLDVTGGTKKSGVNVQLYDYNGSDAQLWRFYSAGNGYYYIKNKLGYYMDVKGASTKNGTNIQVYKGNNSKAQKFKLVPTEADIASTLKLTGQTYPGTINQGSGFTCKGTISSNYKIQKVTVGIWDANNDPVSTYSVYPNSYSYDINKIDSYIHFSYAKPGTNYYEVWAKDAKQTKCLQNTKFTVKEVGSINSNTNINSYGYAQPISVAGAKWSSSTAYNAGCKHDVQVAGILGKPVYAIQDGTIVCEQKVGTTGIYKNKLVSYGNVIRFTSSDGRTKALYAHLQSFAKGSVRISESAEYPCGQQKVGNIETFPCGSYKVKRGEVIGYVGTTGNSTGPHLHFELYRNGTRVSPDLYVKIN